jgi:hypothetical protein
MPFRPTTSLQRLARLRAIAGGASAPSLPTANLVGDYGFAPTQITEVSGRISALLDQSGTGHDLAQATAGNRPIRIANGGPNNRDAGDFTLLAGAMVGLASADVGVGTGAVSIYTVGQIPASGRYWCDGMSLNSRVIFNNGGTSLALFAGSVACGVTVGSSPLAVGDWAVSAAIFNGASSKHALNGGSASTGNVGATTSAGHTIGGISSFGAAQGANCRIARQLIYAAAHDDATRALVTTYLKLWAGIA